MLRGYRGIVAALGLVLAAHHSNAEAQPMQADVQERSASALENIAGRYSDQAERANGSRETEPCKKGESKRYSDLCAQWKAADAAELSAWLNLASIAAVLIALFLAFQSNRIARDTAKRQLRAYVAISDYAIIPDINEPHKIRAIVTYQNVGETPAKDVSATLFVLAGAGAFNDANPRQEPLIDRAGGLAVIGKGSSKQTAIAVEVDGAPADILLNGDYWVCVYGRISYRDVFGANQETRYCAYVDPIIRAVGMVHADAPNGNSMT